MEKGLMYGIGEKRYDKILTNSRRSVIFAVAFGKWGDHTAVANQAMRGRTVDGKPEESG